jgi:ATP-dependent Lhr-like helicase
VPPPAPWHLAAQQIMAACLQESGIERRDLNRSICSPPGLEALHQETFQEIIDFMCRQHILEEDGGILSLGKGAERLFGRRHFSDLVTSFTAPMLIDVRHGRMELGQVDPVTLRTRQGERPVFALAGRTWTVKHIDWAGRVCWVEATGESGSARWLGSARAAHFDLCQSVRRILIEGLPERNLSRRGAAALSDLRASFSWCRPDATTVISGSGDTASWWTFAGARANGLLSAGLDSAGWSVMNSDNFVVRLRTRHQERLSATVHTFPDPEAIQIPIPDRLVSELKFNECLPSRVADEIISSRQSDVAGTKRILTMPVIAATEH